jgi:four helix bundle protein
LGFQNTIVYQKSLELVEICTTVSEKLPTKYAFVGDQMLRASSSVTLQFSEGCGRRAPAERRRFFMTARGSAHEVTAALDIAAKLKAIDPDAHSRGLKLADELGAMLTHFP